MYICSLDKTACAYTPGMYMQRITNKQTNREIKCAIKDPSVLNTINIIIYTHVYSIPAQ